VRKIAKYMSK